MVSSLLVLCLGAPAPIPQDPGPGATPLGGGPARPPPPRVAETDQRPPTPDRKSTLLLRFNLWPGYIWRTTTGDGLLVHSVEFGKMHGLSGSFHTDFILATGRESVRVLDTAIGAGLLLRGRLARPLYGSIGLSAGVLVHRAETDTRGTLHKVDPDFRLPVQFAWTIHGVGLTLAVVQGFSVRKRTYQDRGAVVWQRDAYRVGLAFGVHFDALIRAKRGNRRGRED